MAKILVAGGSLGGLLVANILLRQGHDIQVLDRASGSMNGRGAGIVTHDYLSVALRAAGVVMDGPLGVSVSTRITLGSDGGIMATLELPQIVTSWSRLYYLLRESFPGPVGHPNSPTPGHLKFPHLTGA